MAYGVRDFARIRSPVLRSSIGSFTRFPRRTPHEGPLSQAVGERVRCSALSCFTRSVCNTIQEALGDAMTDDQDALVALRAENARLIALLEAHGIEWQAPTRSTIRAEAPAPNPSSTAAKVALFRRLFRGRTDVFPIRWESNNSGRSGYAPACANDKFAWKANLHGEAALRAKAMDGPSEWRAGICEKPRIKCSQCGHRSLVPLSDAVIYDHLAGERTIGVYPLLEDDTCYFLAVDFDEAEWRDDARAFVQSCEMLDISVALEISRSGQGAHAWVFFAARVLARDARALSTTPEDIYMGLLPSRR